MHVASWRCIHHQLPLWKSASPWDSYCKSSVPCKAKSDILWFFLYQTRIAEMLQMCLFFQPNHNNYSTAIIVCVLYWIQPTFSLPCTKTLDSTHIVDISTNCLSFQRFLSGTVTADKTGLVAGGVINYRAIACESDALLQ